MANPKGQSSAPFEVLIAVIIMGFVLYMGAQAIIELQQKQCESQIKTSAADLKTAVQDVVRGNSVLLNFFPPKCFKETEMRLNRITSSARCSSLCGRQVNECLFFTFRSEEFAYDLCFGEVPAYTDFLDNMACVDRPGFTTVDFRSGTDNIIPRGVYQLQNLTGIEGGIPKVCAYLRGSS